MNRIELFEEVKSWLEGENLMFAPDCKRRLKSAAGGARKVRHLPGQRELVSLAFVKPRDGAAR